MLTRAHVDEIRRTWRLVEPVSDTASELFYKRLFELAPQARVLFPADLAATRARVMAMLDDVVRMLDWPAGAWQDEVADRDDLFRVLLALGRRHHQQYHVPHASFAHISDVLLWTLDYVLGGGFSADAREAWTRAYAAVARIMTMGCAPSEDTVLTRGSSEEHSLRQVLEAVGLGRQHVAVEVDGGAIRLKGGMVLDATCGARAGREAVDDLLAAPTSSWAVRRLAAAPSYGTPIGSLAELV